MYCGKCGTYIKEGDSFCTQCGEKYKNTTFYQEAEIFDYQKIQVISGGGDANALKAAIEQFINEINAHSLFSTILSVYKNIFDYLEKKKDVFTRKLEKLDEIEPNILSARYESWEEKHDEIEEIIETIDDLCTTVEEGIEQLESLCFDLPYLVLDLEQYAPDDIAFKKLLSALKSATLQ